MMFYCIHIAASTLIAYGLSSINGALSASTALVSLFIGAVFAWRAQIGFRAVCSESPWVPFAKGVSSRIEIAIAAFVLFAAYRHFGWMYYVSDGAWRTLHPNNFGDLPLHLNYIRFIANGGPFPPPNPIFVGEPLYYPLGVDLYSALWERLGVPTSSHLFVMGMGATAVSLAALRAWGGWWAMGLFFLGGGWLSWSAFSGSNDAENVIAWKNLFLSVFITQRGMLFALPVGLLLLWLVRRALLGLLVLSRRQLRLLGFLWGALPLFHLHAFFAISLILVGGAIIYRRRSPAGAILWRMLLVAVPLGTVFVLYQTASFSKAGVAHWKSGWMAGDGHFLTFLIVNFRFWLVLVATLPILIWLQRRRGIAGSLSTGLLMEFVLYLGLLVLFLNWMVAPWEWDNIKVLLWPALAMTALANDLINRLAVGRWRSLVETGLAILLLGPGTFQISETLIGTRSSVKLIALDELAAQEGALVSVPHAALLVAGPTHDHPIAFLGRRRTLGYEGHLWSHGVVSQSVALETDRIMRGKPDWEEAVRRLGAEYILWGPAERKIYGEIEPAWKSSRLNVSTVAGYEVYDLRSLSKSE